MITAQSLVITGILHERSHSKLEGSKLCELTLQVQIKQDGRCLSTASNPRASRAVVGLCSADAGWFIVAEASVGGFAKLVHGVAQPGAGGQCLQLHDGLIAEGSYFWLWNCSKGNRRPGGKVIFHAPQYISFVIFYINHSEAKPDFNTKSSISELLHDRVRLDKSFPMGPCSTSEDKNSLRYDVGPHHCDCHVSTQ